MFASAAVDWTAISRERYGTQPPDMLRPRGVWVGVVEADDEEDGGGDGGGGGGDGTPAIGGAFASDDSDDGDDGNGDGSGGGDGGGDGDEGGDGGGDGDEGGGGGGDGGNGGAGNGGCGRGGRGIRLFDVPGFPGGITPSRAHKLLKAGRLQIRKSSDRMSRVTHATCHAGSSGGIAPAAVPSGAPLLACIDALMVVVSCSAGVTAVLLLPTSFDLGAKSGLDAIVESDLKEPSTLVHGNVLRATFVPETQTSDAVLSFGPSTIAEKIKVPGLCVQPCNPEVELDGAGHARWLMPVQGLDALLGSFWDGSIERSRLRVLSEDSVYCDTAGLPLVVADGTETAMPGQKQPRAPKPKAQASAVECELCTRPIERSMMRHHMGSHLLCEDSWSGYSKVKPAMPCGLCGVRTAIGQHLVSSVTMPGHCAVSIAKGKPVHQCQLLRALEYSLAPAAKSATSTPCTNRPLQCPKCPLVVWSYSMLRHFADAHPTADIPEPTTTAVSLGFHEREHVQQLLRSKAAKSVCNGATCLCKK